MATRTSTTHPSASIPSAKSSPLRDGVRLALNHSTALVEHRTAVQPTLPRTGYVGALNRTQLRHEL